MAKKILNIATLGLLGGSKKKAAAPAEQKGPIVKPLTAEQQADPRTRAPAWRGVSPAATIISDKLGS